jgi:hypothetical protein
MVPYFRSRSRRNDVVPNNMRHFFAANARPPATGEQIDTQSQQPQQQVQPVTAKNVREL